MFALSKDNDRLNKAFYFSLYLFIDDKKNKERFLPALDLCKTSSAPHETFSLPHPEILDRFQAGFRRRLI